MGIQINGQTDTISAIDGSLNLTGAELPSVTNLNATGIVTASSFSGALTGNVNATGVSTFNNVVVGGSTTALVVSGNARITGILTVGSGTITINPTTDSISGVTTLGVTTTYTTNLTVNGNAYPTSGPLSNRNLIINGAMAVAQRGTSSTSTGYRTVDRIDSTYAGITQTQSQQSLTSGDPYNEGFRYFYRVTNTSTSSATSAISEIQQKIEGQNINQSGWNFTSSSSYLTVSFWVRSSLAGTYYFWLFSPETSSVGYYRIPFTLSANTWKKVTHTIPGNSGLTIDNDNGIGLHCYWVPHYGTDYTGSTAQTEQWSGRTGNDYLPDFPQNWCNTASATFDITGVQLEPGTVATPFEFRSYGDELRLCQRYYYRIQPTNQYSAFCNGWNDGTTTSRGVIHFPITMRTRPTTLEQTGTASDYYLNATSGGGVCTGVPTFDTSTQNQSSVNWTKTGLTAGQATLFQTNVANAYLAWSAEL